MYYDGRFYETDGENAIGVHDPGAVRLLTPIGTAPTLRTFTVGWDVHGGLTLGYEYANPTTLVGATAEIDLSDYDGSLDFDARVVAIVHDGGRRLDAHEAARAVIGYSVLVQLYDPQGVDTARLEERTETPARDFGGFFGPFLVTPDDLTEAVVGGDQTRFLWGVEAKVNGEVVWTGQPTPVASFADMIVTASQSAELRSGELLAAPAFDKPRLDTTALGRSLLPGDQIAVTVEPLGTLVGRIA